MDLKSKLLISIAGAIAVLVLMFFAEQRAFHAGELAERQVWQERQAKEARERADITSEANRLGNRAAAASLTREQAERDFSQQLSQERSHVVLAVPAAACPDRRAAQSAASLGLPSSDRASPRVAQAQTGPQVSPPVDQSVDASAHSAMRLTPAAVGLWNSALTGVREPAGDPCGADAGASAACASGRPITIDDAWDNQAENALRCRVDRLRYQQLIELLHQREALQGRPHGQ